MNNEIGSLSPYWKWPISDLAHKTARDAMDERAKYEIEKVSKGEDLALAHGETVERYPYYEQLIQGSIRFLSAIGYQIRGKAVDMGSGTGVGACILSKRPEISDVYALEYSEGFVSEVMPRVFKEFKAETRKIQRIVGDFNKTKFEDESIDIVLDVDSFHHAEDLDALISEMRRIISPEGVLIAVDRAWPDHYSRAQLNEMLDKQFPDSLKQRYGIPISSSFTRRDWGEHEYTLEQWFQSFNNAGFTTTALIQRVPPIGNRGFLWRLPSFEISIRISSLLYRLGFRRLWLYGYDSPRVVFICFKHSLG